MIQAFEPGIQFEIPSNWVRTGQGNSSTYMTETSENFDNVLSIDIIKPLSASGSDNEIALNNEIENIYAGKSLGNSTLYSDPIIENITIDGTPATMYTYYLAPSDEMDNSSTLEYCKDVLFEHDGQIYHLLFWEGKWVEDRNWPAWLEKIIPQLTVESRLDNRANTILDSIKFE